MMSHWFYALESAILVNLFTSAHLFITHKEKATDVPLSTISER